jgi:hypothetical protein
MCGVFLCDMLKATPQSPGVSVDSEGAAGHVDELVHCAAIERRIRFRTRFRSDVIARWLILVRRRPW